MISVLKDCFDRKGHRYKVVSFIGGRYQCQSYANGKSYYFEPSEISDKPFNHEERTVDFFKAKVEKPKPIENVVEPVYDFSEPVEVVIEEKPVVEEKIVEPIKEEKPVKVEKPKPVEISKDNVKETADDFYADF